MVPVTTPAGEFKVWTRTRRRGPLTVLVLHGGPAATHEYLLDLEQPLVRTGFRVVMYDQLGSFHSDQPDDPSLWEVDRFEGLARITVPTLVIGAEHDTMDPDHLRAMVEKLPNGTYHHCPAGSHLAMVDDHKVYVAGLVTWLVELAGLEP